MKRSTVAPHYAIIRHECGTPLHSFWDGLLGNSSDPAFLLKLGMRLPKADPVLAAKLNADDWIRESFELAKGAVYKSPVGPTDGPYSLTASYHKSARLLAAQRVSLAGARLARILNAELK